MASGSGIFDLVVVSAMQDDGTGGLIGGSVRRLRTDLANLLVAVNLDPDTDAVPAVRAGRYGVASAIEGGSFSSIDIAVPVEEFSSAAQLIDNSANPIAAFPVGVNRAIIDYEVTGMPGETTTVTVRLLERIGTSGSIFVFDLDSRSWVPFGESAEESVGFMQFGGERCPPQFATQIADIPSVLDEYSSTAFAGANCLLIVARDGGPNDADRTADGVFRATLGISYDPDNSTCNGCDGVFLPCLLYTSPSPRDRG